MKEVLQRSNPFQSKICGRNYCIICNQELPLNCRERGCVYELTCLECVNKHYRGQTSRAVYDRTKEHIKDWNDKSENSPLHRHSEIYHNGEKFEISIRLLAKCFGKASRRLIAESVYISELKEEETMNSRHEWSYFPLDMLQELRSYVYILFMEQLWFSCKLVLGFVSGGQDQLHCIAYYNYPRLHFITQPIKCIWHIGRVNPLHVLGQYRSLSLVVSFVMYQ